MGTRLEFVSKLRQAVYVRVFSIRVLTTPASDFANRPARLQGGSRDLLNSAQRGNAFFQRRVGHEEFGQMLFEIALDAESSHFAGQVVR